MPVLKRGSKRLTTPPKKKAKPSSHSPSPRSKSKRGRKAELITMLQKDTEPTDDGVSSDEAAAEWTELRVHSAAAGSFKKGDIVVCTADQACVAAPWLVKGMEGVIAGPCDDESDEPDNRLMVRFDVPAEVDDNPRVNLDVVNLAQCKPPWHRTPDEHTGEYGGSAAGKQVSDGGGSAAGKQFSDGGGSSEEEEEEGEDSAQRKLRICPSAFKCKSKVCRGLWRMPEKKTFRDAFDESHGNKIQSKSSVYQARCGTCHAVFGPTPAEQKISRKKKKKAMDAQGRAEHTRTANERDRWRVHYKLPPLLHGKKAATTEAATAEAATAIAATAIAATADASSEHARDAGDDEEDHASSDAEPSDLEEAKEGHAQHSDALKWDAKKNARWTSGN